MQSIVNVIQQIIRQRKEKWSDQQLQTLNNKANVSQHCYLALVNQQLIVI